MHVINKMPALEKLSIIIKPQITTIGNMICNVTSLISLITPCFFDNILDVYMISASLAKSED